LCRWVRAGTGNRSIPSPPVRGGEGWGEGPSAVEA
jgi:hypothetical protein